MRKLLILSVLLLCSCAVPSRISFVPQASPTARQEGLQQATPQIDKDVKGGTNDAFLMGETSATTPSAPDYGIATQAALISALKAANETTNALQKELSDQKIKALQVQADIENAKAQAAKYDAAQKASAVLVAQADAEKAQAQARKVDAENEAKRLEVQRLQAQADAENAKTQQLLLLFIDALSISGFLLGARVISRRAPVVVEPEAQESEQPDTGPLVEKRIPAMGTMVRRETPPGWSTELMFSFSQTVRRPYNPQGIPLTRDEWVGADKLLSRPLWNQLDIYICTTNNYAYAINATGSLAWTPDGEQWLSLFDGEQAPHSEELPISA